MLLYEISDILFLFMAPKKMKQVVHGDYACDCGATLKNIADASMKVHLNGATHRDGLTWLTQAAKKVKHVVHSEYACDSASSYVSMMLPFATHWPGSSMHTRCAPTTMNAVSG